MNRHARSIAAFAITCVAGFAMAQVPPVPPAPPPPRWRRRDHQSGRRTSRPATTPTARRTG